MTREPTTTRDDRLREAAPAMLAALETWIAAFWGDQKNEVEREWYRKAHPEHPVVASEKAVAKARGGAIG